MMFAFIFQGLHYLCLKCQRVQRFFKAKADVKRHLQEQHSGIQFQCSICGYLFHRRNISHACNATEADMEYVDPITGIYGEQAKQKLRKFINEEQDNYWRYVATMEEIDLPESPFPGVRSVVVRVDPPREPRPRKRRDRTPESLGSPESIVLEEPPTKKRQLDELLQDLACTPSTMSLSSPGVSLSEEDSETDVEIEPSKNPDKHNKKDAKKVDDYKPKQRKNVTDQTKKTEKSTENNKNVDTVQKKAKEMTVMEKTMGTDKKQENKEKDAKVVKENVKRREKEVEKVERKDKDKRKDNVKQMRYSLSEEGEKRSETGQEGAKETNNKHIVIMENRNKTVEGREEDKNEVTETTIRRERESSKKHTNLIERGDAGEEYEMNNTNENKDKKNSGNNVGQVSEKEHKNEPEMRTESVTIEEKVNQTEDEMEEESEVVEKSVNEAETENVENVEDINKPEETKSTEKDNAEKKGENEYGKNNNINKINTEEIMDISDKIETDKQGERNDKMSDKHTDSQNTNIDKTQVKGQYREHVKAKVDNQSERTKGTKELKQTEETEKQKLKRKGNETKSLKDKQNEQKGQKDSSKNKLSKVKDQSKISELKVKEMNNKQVVEDTKVKQTQSKQTQKKGGENKVNKVKKVLSDKNSNRNDAKSVNEEIQVKGKENKVPKPDDKKKVTVKEYQARKLEQNRNEQILDNIMDGMTNTYNNMRVLSPIQNEETTSFSETINAVASITHETIDETYDKAADVVSECALDFIHEMIIQEVVDSTVEDEINTYINEQAQKEITEIEMNENETRERRTAEKRKNSETEWNMVGTKRRFYDNKDNDDNENEIEDKDLTFIAKIQGNKAILNIGGARFETSILTLQKDPKSLLAKLFTSDSPIIPQGNSVFIDRDPSHFKVILNYLRCDLDLNPATLPKERRHLLELKKECDYYRVKGLRKMVKRRLKLTTELYGMD